MRLCSVVPTKIYHQIETAKSSFHKLFENRERLSGDAPTTYDNKEWYICHVYLFQTKRRVQAYATVLVSACQ